jgi:hypothetical protein
MSDLQRTLLFLAAVLLLLDLELFAIAAGWVG